MSRTTRIELIVLAVVLVVLAAPFLIPLNMYRGRMEAAASNALSREVHIKGPLHLTFYPDLGVSLSDVSIGNLKGARNAQMITAEKLVVGAKLMPLFSGELQVTELTLEKPVIHLETVKDAAPNWSFGKAPDSGKPADAAALNRIGFAHLNINNGAITYYDAASGKSAALNEVSLSLNMPDAARPTLSLPLTLAGSVTYNGEALKIDGRLDNFGNLLNGRTTGARISIGSNVINAEFTGQLGTASNLTGSLKLGAHSVRSLAAWLGNPMPPGNGFGLLALEGHFTARDGVYALSHAHLAFDQMNLNGDINLDTNPKVMTLKGQVSIDRLNVNPYLAPGASDDTVKAAKAKAASPDAPMSLGGLRAVNADLTLIVGELDLPDLKLEQTIIKTSLQDGLLQADMAKVSAYGGTGKASLTVDARNAIPQLHSTLDVTDIKVQPFLAQMMHFDRISGKGSVRYDVAATGDTAKAMLANLDGKGDIHFTEGAISGADLVAISRVLQSVVNGDALGAAIGESASTPFGKMGANFTIAHGIMQTKDFQLVNPTVEMNGRGNVDLNARTLEFHFEPKAVKGIPGLKLVDIGVPFYVKGPWDKPGYGPDVRGLAKTIVEKLENGATSPLDVLTQPGLSLKSLLGTGRTSNK
ncbi:MAG TPA: AsmA family protein [Micropepsaceae bacterium]